MPSLIESLERLVQNAAADKSEASKLHKDNILNAHNMLQKRFDACKEREQEKEQRSATQISDLQNAIVREREEWVAEFEEVTIQGTDELIDEQWRVYYWPRLYYSWSVSHAQALVNGGWWWWSVLSTPPVYC